MAIENFEQNYLSSIEKLFKYYKSLGEKTFEQLTEAELHFQQHEMSNSIAVIVNHMQGNMKSRWTNFLTEDGEKEWRNRDVEFEDIIQSKQELIEKWEEGWTCLFEALSSVNENNFDKTIYIRNQGHSITEAINRQLSHYAYHVGQIVFAAKLLKGESWQSLSIPKGKSKAFNDNKFAQKKKDIHFTDEILNTTDKN